MRANVCLAVRMKVLIMLNFKTKGPETPSFSQKQLTNDGNYKVLIRLGDI